MTQSPKAKNNLNAKAMYNERINYIGSGYKLLKKTNAIDLWYGEKALYGKIDHRGIPQIISESNLKDFPSAPGVAAADFVVDAFQDLRDYLILANRRKKINLSNSFMGMFVPKIGWLSPREEFDTRIRQTHSSFVEIFLENGNRHTEIRTFGGFIKLYKEFARATAGKSPITLSGVVTSRFTHPGVSGLVIEYASAPYDKDKLKYESYLANPNFNFFQEAARKFGFRIDYNVPWRIIADVSSAEMKKYMNKYGINSTAELFDIYYYNAHRLDLAMLKKYMIQFYNDYVSGNPIIKIVKSGSVESPEVKSYIIRREQVREEEVDSVYDNFYWLNFYYIVRSSELNLQWSDTFEAKKLQETKNLLFVVDFSRALEYLVKEMNS